MIKAPYCEAAILILASDNRLAWMLLGREDLKEEADGMDRSMFCVIGIDADALDVKIADR